MSNHPDADDPSQDDRVMTRSEERLTGSTRRVPVATVRLERYQVTETRTITVDLARDRVRMITTPSGGDPQVTDDPPGDPSWTHLNRVETDADGSRWLILTEERLVVTKETVPVERVRLALMTSTTDQVVSDTVRVERIELVDPDTGAPITPTT